MILHQDHQFIFNNHVAFELPNGMCINYNAEIELEEAFWLIAPDKSFRLMIDFFQTEKDSKTFIEELRLEGFLQSVLKPAHAVTIPSGLRGYSTIFESKTEIYEEYAIELGGCSDPTLLDLWTVRIKDQPYDKELHDRAMAEILASVKIV